MDLHHSATDIQKIVAKVCARGLSIGADGLIMLEPCDTADFQWRFFNSDGGDDATMCGNGARCAARFAYLKGYAGVTMSFLTGAGIIRAEIKEAPNVKVQLTQYKDMEIEHAGGFVDTGVPHVVIFEDEIENVDMNNVGKRLRHERNANINFVKVLGTHSLRVRTYERGVESETLACGTGSVASTLIAIEKGFASSPVNIKTSGGIDLTVYKEGNDTYLEGEARLVTEGVILPEGVNY
jgi:diaminopimelate epimerase